MTPKEPARTETLRETTIAAGLRFQRTAAHLGLRETARLAGISPGYLSDLESGRKAAHPAVVGKLCDAIANHGGQK